MSAALDVETKFFAKVTAPAEPDDCWLWTAAKDKAGYGRFNVGPGVVVLAHRWAYHHLVVDVPSSLDLDHLCHEPACVNPWHLDPVTRAVNLARRRTTGGELNAAKTHCPVGHPYDQRNTRRYRGRRFCRACDNQRTNPHTQGATQL